MLTVLPVHIGWSKQCPKEHKARCKILSELLRELKKDERAGTGFREQIYSPAYVVHFDPEHSIAEKIVLKYEWRSELCRKGIIPCGPKNRFWPDDYEFAPIPKDFRG